jgi:hypothetical protein
MALYCRRLRGVRARDGTARVDGGEAMSDRDLAAVAAERARCAAVCRQVAQFYDPGDIGSVVALACADSIELDIQQIAK